MGEPKTHVVDVECLRESDRRRGSCLNTFLIMSIVFLFVAVTAVAVGGVMMTMELRSELRTKVESMRSITVGETSQLVEQAGEEPSVYKMQNLAFLQAKISELNNSTIQWGLIHHGTTTSLGSNFNLDPEERSVTLKKSGSYFMYLDLKISCVTSRCSSGIFTVQVGDVFKCEVEIPHGSTSVSRKCWTVNIFEKGKTLTAQMFVPKTGLNNWKLDEGSQLGVFLID